MLMKQPGLLPYEVGRFAYVPGSRPYIFYLVMGAGAPHVPGILEKIVRVFGGKGRAHSPAQDLGSHRR